MSGKGAYESEHMCFCTTESLLTQLDQDDLNAVGTPSRKGVR